MKSLKVCSILFVLTFVALCLGCFSMPSVAPRRSFSATSLLEDAITNKIASSIPVFSFTDALGQKVELYKVDNLDDLKGTWVLDNAVHEGNTMGYGYYSDATLTYPSKTGKDYADLSATADCEETLKAGAIAYAYEYGMNEEEAMATMWKEVIENNKDDPNFTYTAGAPYQFTEIVSFEVEDAIGISKDKKYVYILNYGIVFTKAK